MPWESTSGDFKRYSNVLPCASISESETVTSPSTAAPGLQLHSVSRINFMKKNNNTLKENDINALTTGYVANAVTVWVCLWFSITGSLWQVWNASKRACETIDDVTARGGVSERDGRLGILMTRSHLHINEFSQIRQQSSLSLRKRHTLRNMLLMREQLINYECWAELISIV